MDLFKKKTEPATEIDLAAVADAGMGDTEKQDLEHLKSDGLRHQHHVDPVAEARVVRKMDLRLVPLVTALCQYNMLAAIYERQLIFHRLTCIP